MAECESSDDEGNAGENDSDSQRCTSDVGAAGLSKNSKHKRKDPKFVDSWLEVKEFKGWLAKRRGTDGKVKPYCKICLLEINSTKTGIQRHMECAKHRSKVQSAKGSHNISILIKRNSFENERIVIGRILRAIITQFRCPWSGTTLKPPKSTVFYALRTNLLVVTRTNLQLFYSSLLRNSILPFCLEKTSCYLHILC